MTHGLKPVSDEYAGYRDAGIRLTEPLLPSLQKQATERTKGTGAAIHAFDKAHLVMLVEEHLVDHEAGAAMLRALRDLDRDRADGGGKHGGERQMIRTFGQDVGGQLHLGRSSGDLGAVARRLTIRAAAIDHLDALLKLRRVALQVGRRHAATVMPGSTHLQHGQPTTFGHWATMWNHVFGRDFHRTAALLRRVNGSPAGAAILTGSDFPLNRQRTAQLLGFDHVLEHTWDAVQSVDDLFEAAAVFALTAADLERLGADLQLFMSTELRYVDVPDRFCGTSSIMAQKRNPAWMGEAKGVGGQTLGALVAAVSMANGPTGAPIQERNMAEPLVFQSAEAITARLLEGVDLLRSLQPDVERLAALTAAHWAAATDLAGAIVRRCRLDWRSAHQIVGLLVRLCEERHISPSGVTPELLDEVAVAYHGAPVGLDQATIADALDPAACVRRRRGVGGPDPATHLEQIERDAIAVDADQRQLDAIKASLARAARDLESAIDKILGVRYRSPRLPIEVGHSPGHAEGCCG